MLNCPTTCAGALDNVNAELEKLSAKIDAVEKEIGDTMVELRTARENGDAGEVGRQSKREEALRDKEKLLLEERRALREGSARKAEAEASVRKAELEVQLSSARDATGEKLGE